MWLCVVVPLRCMWQCDTAISSGVVQQVRVSCGSTSRDVLFSLLARQVVADDVLARYKKFVLTQSNTNLRFSAVRRAAMPSPHVSSRPCAGCDHVQGVPGVWSLAAGESQVACDAVREMCDAVLLPAQSRPRWLNVPPVATRQRPSPQGQPRIHYITHNSMVRGSCSTTCSVHDGVLTPRACRAVLGRRVAFLCRRSPVAIIVRLSGLPASRCRFSTHSQLLVWCSDMLTMPHRVLLSVRCVMLFLAGCGLA